MIYREHPLPAEALAAAFCAWRFALEAGDPKSLVHTIPPDGTTNLLVVLGPDGERSARVVGPSLVAQTTRVHAGWRFAGLRLRPEAAVARFGELEPVYASLARLAEREESWRLGDAATALLVRGASRDDAVAAAVDLLIASGGTAPIGFVARAAGLGERQLRRRFSAATGLAPKQFASVQRVRRALILSLAGESWADVAFDAGFADQPHLNRSVRAAFGAAPRVIGGYVGGIRHEFLDPDPVRFVQDSGDRAA